MQMPHESTLTEQESIKFQADEERLVQSRTRSRSHPLAVNVHGKPPPGSAAVPFRQKKALSLVAETPTKITHHHDEDDDDDSQGAKAAA